MDLSALLYAYASDVYSHRIYPRERMACLRLVGFPVLLMPFGGLHPSDTYLDSKQERSHLWKTQGCYKCMCMDPPAGLWKRTAG